MKKTLLLFAITMIFAQQTQAQTIGQELIEVGLSSLFSGSSKKQKKIEREKFVKDSTNNAVATKKKERVKIVNDSTKNAEYANRQNELDKAEEKKRKEWYFKHYDENPYSFTFNKNMVVYFVEKNKDSPRIAMEIFSDTTTTNKIGSVKLSELSPTEVFDVLAYNTYGEKYLIRSQKDNKICVVHEDVQSYQIISKNEIIKLTTEYINPKIVAQNKLLLDNYRLKLNNAVATVNKLEAINNKHLVNMVNMYGVVVEQRFDTTKFTTQEKATYKQLIFKLEKQRDEIKTELVKEIRKNHTMRSLINANDTNKQMRVDHAYSDYAH